MGACGPALLTTGAVLFPFSFKGIGANFVKAAASGHSQPLFERRC
jgi:hypothetical protein